jgi:ribosomal protein L10
LGNAPFVALTDFKGSTVKRSTRSARSGIRWRHFRVVKNTLADPPLRAPTREARALLQVGNIGVIVSGDDPVAAAKVARTVLKENAKLQVRAGFFDGDVLDAKA